MLRQFQLQSQVYSVENRGYYLPILQQPPTYPTLYNWAQDPVLRAYLFLPKSAGFYMGGRCDNQLCGEATLA